MACGGCMPTNSATTSPSRNALTAGMLITRKLLRQAGLASMSTLASTTSSPRFSTADSSTGAS